VFDAWCVSTGRDAARAKLTSERVKKITQRLAEGYSVDELVEAVNGVALSAFHMGENDKKQKYDDLTTVLRSGSQVEKFRDLFRDGPVKRGPKSFATILSAVEKIEQGMGGPRELA
jgi:thymidine phosphorylase